MITSKKFVKLFLRSDRGTEEGIGLCEEKVRSYLLKRSRWLRENNPRFASHLRGSKVLGTCSSPLSHVSPTTSGDP